MLNRIKYKLKRKLRLPKDSEIKIDGKTMNVKEAKKLIKNGKEFEINNNENRNNIRNLL